MFLATHILDEVQKLYQFCHANYLVVTLSEKNVEMMLSFHIYTEILAFST